MRFTPASGYCLIDPLEKDRKSDLIAVSDPIDKPHKGKVMAIGADTFYSNTDKIYKCPVKVGDNVLYSIAGIESFKMEYEGNPRHEFIMCPFSRILGIFK